MIAKRAICTKTCVITGLVLDKYECTNVYSVFLYNNLFKTTLNFIDNVNKMR